MTEEKKRPRSKLLDPAESALRSMLTLCGKSIKEARQCADDRDLDGALDAIKYMARTASAFVERE